MNPRKFLTSLAYAGSILCAPAFGAGQLVKDCNLAQGFYFSPNSHNTVGYITELTIDGVDVLPDIRVNMPGVTATGSVGGVFSYPVVSVLTTTSWSTHPNENIVIEGRVTPTNAHALNAMIQGLKTGRIEISFVVFDYDFENRAYYASFASHLGVAPAGTVAKTYPGTSPAGINPIYGLAAKAAVNTFAIKVGKIAITDIPGIPTYAFDLTLAPAAATSWQQILGQTSVTDHLILPFGILH